MPKPSPLQAIAIVAFLFFYGFAVFALTRDYYLRHPPQVAAAPAPVAPHAGAPVQPRPAAVALADDLAFPPQSLRAIPCSWPSRPTNSSVRVGTPRPSRSTSGSWSWRRPIWTRTTTWVWPCTTAARPQAALDVLARGTTMGPEFQRIWLTYGFVLTKTGDTATATSALTKARDLDPNNGVGQEAARLLGIIQDICPDAALNAAVCTGGVRGA